jgi:serralysin
MALKSPTNVRLSMNDLSSYQLEKFPSHGYHSRRSVLALWAVSLVSAGVFPMRIPAYAQSNRSPSGIRHTGPIMPYPTSLTTGVPEGVTLTSSGDVVVTKAGAVVEGLDIRGTVIIQADNVTIKNCNIKFSGDFGVYVDAGGASVINCDIDGQGTAKPGSMGIAGSGTFINNDIRGVENGIAVWWGGTTVRGNYIHDLKGPGSDPHYDGIQIMGGNIDGVLVEGNTILTRDTSAIFCDNMAGSLSNITIRQNYLDGPCSFPLYFDGAKSSYPMKNIVWEENYIGKGVYGFEYITPDSYGNTPSRSGNIYTDNPLPPGQAPLLGATTPTSP